MFLEGCKDRKRARLLRPKRGLIGFCKYFSSVLSIWTLNQFNYFIFCTLVFEAEAEKQTVERDLAFSGKWGWGPTARGGIINGNG